MDGGARRSRVGRRHLSTPDAAMGGGGAAGSGARRAQAGPCPCARLAPRGSVACSFLGVSYAGGGGGGLAGSGWTSGSPLLGSAGYEVGRGEGMFRWAIESTETSCSYKILMNLDTVALSFVFDN